MNRCFEDKTVIVTGAASGIGRATAWAFAREGARVVIADINDAGATETYQLITEEGGTALVVQCDISNDADVRAVVTTTVERFGGVDVLINNAAMFLRRGVDLATFEDWARILQTNVAGTSMLSRYAAEAMRERGGAIVIVNSMNGRRADKNYATYCASKAALLMLARCMALDFAEWKIRVNSVLPGAVETPALVGALQEANLTVNDFLPLAESQQCLKGLVQPEDVAASILFLASDKTRMITGAELLVDAGWQASK